MTSQIVIENFRGSGTLASTSPGTLTGVSAATWETYDLASTPNSAYQRAGTGTTVVVPSSGDTNLARLDFVGGSVTHSAGLTVVEAKLRPEYTMRVSMNFEAGNAQLGVSTSGAGSWNMSLGGSASGTFTAATPGAAMVLRIEIGATQTQFFVDGALVATRTATVSYGVRVDFVRLNFPRLTTHGLTIGSTASALTYLHLQTEASSGPLGGPADDPQAIMADAGPLQAAQLLARVFPAGLLSLAGPLGAPAATVDHDFTAMIEAAGAVEFYVCDLVDDGTVTRVPISSWQGTQQIDGACYLQAVVPAVADLAAMIGALSSAAELVISRCARLQDGTTVQQEMARSVIEQSQLDQGAQRYTCTLSGYAAPSTAPDGDGPPVRDLRGIRSTSIGSGGVRVRCAIDWFLRPGARAQAGAIALTADFINYYVGGGDAYMDTGERA